MFLPELHRYQGKCLSNDSLAEILLFTIISLTGVDPLYQWNSHQIPSGLVQVPPAAIWQGI